LRRTFPAAQVGGLVNSREGKMDGAELDNFRRIARLTIATYLIAIAVTLAFGIDPVVTMAS